MTKIIIKSKGRAWLWFLAIAVLIFGLSLIHGILTPFVAGLLVAYMLNPVVQRMEKYRLQRTISTTLLIFAFFIALGGTLFVALPFLKRELLKLAYLMPKYVNNIINFVDPYLLQVQDIVKTKEIRNLNDTISSYFGDMVSWGLTFVAGLFSNTLALANLLSLVILTPVISFYFLRDWPRFIAVVDNLLPRDQAPRIRALFIQINEILASYLRGQSLVCLCLGLYYAVGLTLAGLDFSVHIGLITGALAFIPYFGYLIGVCAGIGVAMGQFTDSFHLWMVIGVFIGGQLFESYYLVPNLVGDRIGLHPIWIIFALLTGGILFGFVGILFAMPMAATAGVLVRFAVKEYRQSSFYLQDSKNIPKIDIS